MTLLRVKYLQHPYATEASWISRNPTLKKGEEGIAIVVVNGVTALRRKVGPGRWNDLQYYDGTVWTNGNAVASPIGEASGNLAGLTPIQILDKMLNPYQSPVISGALNNGGGAFASISVVEIGLTISAAIVVRYTITNPTNLVGTNPISISGQGRFTNEGTFPVGDASLTHAPFNPITLDTITVSIQATHQKGVSNIATTQLRFDPKIIHVVSQTKVLTGASIMQLANKQYTISRTFKRDYSFGAVGHSIVCIPTMLTPASLIFTDVTDPNAPSGYAMDNLGIMTINNGVGTYTYQVYASTYYLLNPTILRIS